MLSHQVCVFALRIEQEDAIASRIDNATMMPTVEDEQRSETVVTLPRVELWRVDGSASRVASHDACKITRGGGRQHSSGAGGGGGPTAREPPPDLVGTAVARTAHTARYRRNLRQEERVLDKLNLGSFGQ